jgi:hypothetical protein
MRDCLVEAKRTRIAVTRHRVSVIVGTVRRVARRADIGKCRNFTAIRRQQMCHGRRKSTQQGRD